MNFFHRLMFDLWYLRHPPWDSGIVPPEVEDFIRDNPPGCALDLGCGSGTSSLALVRAGWRVTGVDFARGAIRIAKHKTRLANLTVDFHVADVTCLLDSLFTISYDLVLDIGCFHSLSPSGKAAYLNQLDRLLAPGGTWLLYGFLKPDERPGPGLTSADLESIQLKLTKRQDGVDRKTRPSAWFWFKKE
ncbi:MAG: class I SAM-dependent methyltransferase [Chloroflexi bacterium]|nr:class I SAM-dependent methyltransferase [Chloroflexota bacterium]